MQIEEEYIRLIFGLKLKQLRNKKNLSLYGLSKLTGLSKSYLNEIENGKKYPKRDKILLLGEALGAGYDEMVSLKLDKNLAPIGEILEKGILKEIPLELFGIAENDLIALIANAPARVNVFISTLIEIAQSYNLSIEGFYLAALRSHQEAENNFFPDLEDKVTAFAEANQIDLEAPIPAQELEAILKEEYGYTILENALSGPHHIDQVRSLFVPQTRTLLLSDGMDQAQRNFIYAKELAYNYLNLQKRPFTFTWIRYNSFDEVLHNFYASYFAGALLIPRLSMKRELEHWLSQPHWSEQNFTDLLRRFDASPETVYQRLTNLLPGDFNFKNLFFLRFNHRKGDDKYYLTKELHITQHQAPHANEFNEHYCRRWVSLKTLQNFRPATSGHHFEAQISQYENGSEYLVMSSATEDPFNHDQLRSISIGILLNPATRKKYPFTTDPEIPRVPVGVTCERCGRMQCEDRAAPPKWLQKIQKHQETAAKVEEIIKYYSEPTKN